MFCSRPARASDALERTRTKERVTASARRAEEENVKAESNRAVVRGNVVREHARDKERKDGAYAIERKRKGRAFAVRGLRTREKIAKVVEGIFPRLLG